MRTIALALLLAAGCAQVPASAPSTVVAVEPPVAVSEVPPAPRVVPQATAHTLAADARGWQGGLELADLERHGERARELRGELRGAYERAMMRLRGQFTLPTAYRREAEATVAPGGWAPIRGQ